MFLPKDCDMKNVGDPDVFKLAHQLALKFYSASNAFAREEFFSLGDETRRADAFTI